ncbi:CHASE3 domain-containing protein, partial [uncultured Sphingomonas sp.]
MFASLSSRVAALGVTVVIAVAALAGLLVDAARQTRDSFLWVEHSAIVLEITSEAVADLRDAESGQRGFVLT